MRKRCGRCEPKNPLDFRFNFLGVSLPEEVVSLS